MTWRRNRDRTWSLRRNECRYVQVLYWSLPFWRNRKLALNRTGRNSEWTKYTSEHFERTTERFRIRDEAHRTRMNHERMKAEENMCQLYCQKKEHIKGAKRGLCISIQPQQDKPTRLPGHSMLSQEKSPTLDEERDIWLLVRAWSALVGLCSPSCHDSILEGQGMPGWSYMLKPFIFAKICQGDISDITSFPEMPK